MPASSGPFARVLVPYDGSEPAKAALLLALKIVPAPAKLVIVTVVDETAVIAQSAMAMVAYDPTPLFEALDAQGKALLADAVMCATRQHVVPTTELVHDTPASAIVDTIDTFGVDLVVMGTHARSGLSQMFIGSTTKNVLRSTSVPVLTVRCTDVLDDHPLQTILLGIDDSDASDAAVALTAKLAGLYKANVTACSAVDVTTLDESAAAYPRNAERLVDELHASSEAIVAASLKRATFADGSVPICIIDGKPAAVLLAEAKRIGATMIMVGSHGRRGLQRLFLGSVAEELVRTSDVPVLVVRGSA